MAEREIGIRLTIPGDPGDTAHDEMYADAANAVWMNLKAMAEPGRFEYEIDHDNQRSDLGQQMNDRWDVYGKETRWS